METEVKQDVNGLPLVRYTVNATNVDDLTKGMTAKKGTRYEIMPGKVCVMQKATWQRVQQYDAFVEEMGEHADEINKVESPWHWVRCLIKKAAIICIPLDFTWDDITLDMDNAGDLSISVLQRIGSDFRYATNGNR